MGVSKHDKSYSSLEIDVEELEYQMNEVGMYSVIQGICDFNLFWVATLPMVCRHCVIDFLFEHVNKFKRKLTLREFFVVDFIISNFHPVDFDEFSGMYKRCKQDVFYYKSKINGKSKSFSS